MNTTILGGRIANPSWQKQVDAGEQIIKCLMAGFNGSMEVRLWGAVAIHVGQGAPEFVLTVHEPALLRRVVMNTSPMVLVEAHFKGELDFEGDVYAVLKMRKHFEGIKLSWKQKAQLVGAAMRLPSKAAQDRIGKVREAASKGFEREHTKGSDKQAISFHYDVSNAFYRTFLDAQMIYSCAYFADEKMTLEQAQEAKLDHICKKLRLQPGEMFLDIGCGWGAMVCWAAKHYGVRAHGVTLSEEQLKVARQRIKDEGLEDRVTVELRDYRDLEGTGVFDKISSIGMFEHVGLKNLPEYNRKVNELLKADGLFLNHGITHATFGWNTGLNSSFLQKYVFPDGELDTVSHIQVGMEKEGFEIIDVEALRPHYARTLREWVSRLEGNKAEALTHVDEATYRVWRMYLAGSAVEFEQGGTGIHQILGAKWRRSEHSVPSTRQDIYAKQEKAQVG